MASFENAIDHTLRWEGGYVNHPNDPGGATNRGITWKVFQKYALSLLGILPTLDALKNLTVEQAKIIYKNVFWDGIDADYIQSQEVANIYFDGFVNMGNNAIRLMQEVLRSMGFAIAADGIAGPKTLAALNAANPGELYMRYKDARVEYYIELADKKPSLAVFLKGWLNRILSFPDLDEKKNFGSVES